MEKQLAVGMGCCLVCSLTFTPHAPVVPSIPGRPRLAASRMLPLSPLSRPLTLTVRCYGASSGGSPSVPDDVGDIRTALSRHPASVTPPVQVSPALQSVCKPPADNVSLLGLPIDLGAVPTALNPRAFDRTPAGQVGLEATDRSRYVVRRWDERRWRQPGVGFRHGDGAQWLTASSSVLPPPPRYPTGTGYNGLPAGAAMPMIETNNILSNPTGPEYQFLVGEGKFRDPGPQ